MSDFDTKMTELGLQLQIHALKKENAELKAWKESALELDRELQSQATAKLLGAKLGQSCHKVIGDRVPELVAENAALRADLIEVKKAFAPIFVREMHGECIKLERENAALRAALDRLSYLARDMRQNRSTLRAAIDAARKETQP